MENTNEEIDLTQNNETDFLEKKKKALKIIEKMSSDRTTSAKLLEFLLNFLRKYNTNPESESLIELKDKVGSYLCNPLANIFDDITYSELNYELVKGILKFKSNEFEYEIKKLKNTIEHMREYIGKMENIQEQLVTNVNRNSQFIQIIINILNPSGSNTTEITSNDDEDNVKNSNEEIKEKVKKPKKEKAKNIKAAEEVVQETIPENKPKKQPKAKKSA
jgi:hypothetical protein